MLKAVKKIKKENELTNNSIWRTVNLATLYDSQEYQRPLSGTWVNKKVKEFDEGLVGSLIVNQRSDGTLSLIDGKHRKNLLLKKGYKEWMCQIFVGLNYFEEAEMFYRFNSGRRTVTTYQTFKAMLESNNQEAVTIYNIVTKYGFSIGNGGSNTNKIQSVKSLYEIYQDTGEQGLDRIMNLLKLTWNGNKYSFDNHMLSAMKLIIKKCGDCFTDSDFIYSLKKVEPIKVLSEGKATQGASFNNKRAYAIVILNYYNFKRRTNLIPEKKLFE